MSHNAAPKPPMTTNNQSRWLAVIVTFTMFGMGIVIGLTHGKGISQAVSDGAAGAIGGLVGWVVYHLVSRHNNSIFAFVMGILPITKQNSMPFLPTVAKIVIVTVPFHCMVGLLVRRRDKSARIPKPTDPLFDAEVDRSS